MFTKIILGRSQDEKIGSNWRVHRYDKRDNSACRKWQSEFRTIVGNGCTSIEINLDGYDKKYFAITVHLNLTEYVNPFKDYIQKKNLKLTPEQIVQSRSFPQDIVIEKMSFEATCELLSVINEANMRVDSTTPTVLPIKELIDEAAYIKRVVEPSIAVIQADWAKSNN
jgi:hypothetical protein